MPAPVEPGKRVIAGELPGGRVAVMVHAGPYTTLTEAGEAMRTWMAAQGCAQSGDPWEIYRSDPALEPDESKWETEVVYPIE